MDVSKLRVTISCDDPQDFERRFEVLSDLVKDLRAEAAFESLCNSGFSHVVPTVEVAIGGSEIRPLLSLEEVRRFETACVDHLLHRHKPRVTCNEGVGE